MGKHLSLSDRAIIEKLLAQDYTFAYIARQLGRSSVCISKEVKKHRCFANRYQTTDNDCAHFRGCLRNNICNRPVNNRCRDRCKLCTEIDCTLYCKSYESIVCPRLFKPPYVCNGCPDERTCTKNHAYYSAHRAHANYLSLLKSSRSGLRTPPEKLQEINEVISPLILKGQSINHIMATHKDEIGVSERTLYKYIECRAFDVGDLDLPKKVKYRQRRQHKVITKFEYTYRKGRTIEDFSVFTSANPRVPIVEMDTVKGARGSKKVLLTLIFRNTNFMLIFLMPDGTQESVLAVFDMLTNRLGVDTFRRLFPVILTDNGVEFKNPHELEFTETGTRRTRLFYCDPQASWQKAQVEKNHVLIRRILPKGTSFLLLNEEDIYLITCHINSVSRELFQNKTPFDLMQTELQKKLLDTLGLHAIPPDDVVLKPKLIKH